MSTTNSSVVRIGTHNGVFHADEIIACTILRHMPEYSKAEIVRTRDEMLLQQCNVVVDVGGIFDPKFHRYDHHQRGFDLCLKDFVKDTKWDIKMSSAGLVYVHFGHRFLSSVLHVKQDNPMVNIIFDKLYDVFFSEIDAIDNGVNITDGNKRYSIHTGISSRVSMMNPQWNETDADETQRFHEAMAMVENELLRIVRHLAEVWYPARDLVHKALVDRYEVDPSGAIISLESHPCPWSSHIFELERLHFGEDGSPLPEFTDVDLKEFKGRPLFCLYQRKDTNWSVQTIPRSDLEKFSKRLPFPEPWCGLRDASLSEVTGIPECVFAHAGGFLAINRTREGALQLARVAIKLAKVIV